MNNNLKKLFGVIAATVLLVGSSGAQIEADVQKTTEPTKETKTMILIKTTKGDIKLELDAVKAPKTVANFLKYVESGHYSNTIFHRVISNFMIQGGGMTANMAQKKAPYTVENEANNGLKNVRGSIAMARTSDPHSAGAQFFINVVDNGFLDFKAPTQQGWGYCVFGKVVEGMDVVDAIRAVPTAPGDVPKETITITEVSVIK
jgi:peptidyl-prolyl cis-trans isomerase B (cyclophilin B)